MLTWAQFDDAVRRIAEQVREVRSVYGVPRGGQVLAVALSHRLGVPLAMFPSFDTLVVDDVVETGRTMDAFHLHYRRPFWAWVNKSERIVNCCLTLPLDTWVVFPWEDPERAAADAAAYYASRQ